MLKHVQASIGRDGVRVVFNTMVMLSLLLFMTAAVFWFESYQVCIDIARTETRASFDVVISRGEIYLSDCRYLNLELLPQGSPARLKLRSGPTYDLIANIGQMLPQTRPPVAGFFVGRIDDSNMHGTLVLLPVPFVAAVFAVFPAIAIILFRQRRCRSARKIAGCCLACGYDLRATPEPCGVRLARCPECGESPGALS